jgi:putative CocE/NonD family hydrolase
MRYVDDFPRRVTSVDHVWIPMRDGVRLSARIWMPEDAEADPVPAVMEYIPYRKDDATLPSDSLRHPYFAGHGYASVRVDIRGAGDSEGLLLDEYLRQEQDDALDVLAWLAGQPWCTGDVGMMGFSWGGFNSLQVAARRPPQLKAIVTINSADDRYAGDCHYCGGALLAEDMLSWATTMAAYTARPPDPGVVGDSWREVWRERLEGCPPYVNAWLSHQLYDDFWKHGSVCEDFSAISCPVFAVGGWHDPYRDTVFHLLENLSVPRLGLIGPWAHGYPDEAHPGPQIGFNQECLRWWDHWLKGIDTGIMNEPVLRAYILDAHRPATFFDEHPGHWLGEPTWPARRCPETLYLGDSRLLGSPDEAAPAQSIAAVQTAGRTAGAWCAYAGPTELPPDQRPDDALSLVFDSAPLTEPLEILGCPAATLDLSVDQPLAMVAVRLCDVDVDGASSLITRGVLNLTHRESRETPSLLEPGARFTVRVPMLSIGYRLAPGHKLRLAVSPTYWPWIWPSPKPVTLRLHPSRSALELPARELAALSPEPTFAPVEVSRPPDTVPIQRPKAQRTETLDVGTGRFTIHYYPDHLPGRFRIVATGRELGEFGENAFSIIEGDPLSAETSSLRTVEVAGDGWEARTEVRSRLTCDESTFCVETRIEAFEDGESFFERTWKAQIPREFG